MISPGLRFGRYEVGERIGKGGFGVVHFAKDTELGRDVAIKFLRPEYQVRPHVVQRFLQEARAAARIGHPGIVTVFECGQIAGTGLRADGTAFIAMELLKGKSLSDALEASGRMPPALAISIGRQLASALGSAHEAGIIHRDLKPDNVFLVPDPAVRGGVRVKILDFGVAKLAEPTEAGLHTHSQVMLGTPRYMSPEQARSAARVDHRSDVYALGCILYELISGRPPYSGDPGDLIAKHQSAPVPPLRKADGAPPGLDRLISTMLAKTPDERPASMAEVDASLGACEALAAAQGRAARNEAPDEPTVPMVRAEAATVPVLREQPPTLVQPPIAVDPTLSEATAVRLPRPPPPPMRLPLLIAGGLVVGGLVTFLVLRAEDDAPARPGPADAAIAIAPAPADAPAAEPDAAAEAPAAAGETELQCMRHEADRKWDDLDACAERLEAIDAAAAKRFQDRASLEIRAGLRIVAFNAALRDGDLEKARQELDQIPPAASGYREVKRGYDAAEAAAIAALVARLERVKGGDCKEYNAIVGQERQRKPPRVAAEATRQVRCTAGQPAAPPCDHEGFADKAREHHAAGRNAAAYVAFEQAYACSKDASFAEKAFISACNIPNLAWAKLQWRRLNATYRQRARMICIRNGIQEDMLNAR
jgi:hypothetical protein